MLAHCSCSAVLNNSNQWQHCNLVPAALNGFELRKVHDTQLPKCTQLAASSSSSSSFFFFTQMKIVTIFNNLRGWEFCCPAEPDKRTQVCKRCPPDFSCSCRLMFIRWVSKRSDRWQDATSRGGEWEVVTMVPRCSLCSSSHDFQLLIKGLTPKLLECVLISL